MPTRCFTTFPATGVKAGLDNVLHSVSDFIIGKFPQRTIRSINIDTKDKMRDFYKNALEAYSGKVNENLEGIQELVKIPKPHMFVGYTFDNFDTKETGFGEAQPWNFPSAHYLDNNLTSAFPILHDKERDIYLATYNLRIRVTAEFLFNCNSKEEQVSLYIYMKNFIREIYSHVIRGINTQFVLPNSLIESIKDKLFGDVPYSDVGCKLDEYLDKYSLGAIKPVYKNGNSKDKFYTVQYDYTRIDFKVSDEIQLDEGEKKDMAYDNYTIRFPAILEVYVPVTYVLRNPKMVIGFGGVHTTPELMTIDSRVDENVNKQVHKVPRKYVDTLERGYIDKRFELFKRDEFALAGSEDYYDIRFAFTEDDVKIFDSLTEEQKQDTFKVLLFEGNNMLDESLYRTPGKNWIFNIHKGEINKNQTIEIYVDFERLNKYVKENANKRGKR